MQRVQWLLVAHLRAAWRVLISCIVGARVTRG